MRGPSPNHSQLLTGMDWLPGQQVDILLEVGSGGWFPIEVSAHMQELCFGLSEERLEGRLRWPAQCWCLTAF